MIEQQQSEKSVFLAAIEIDSATERAEFLDQACAGNASLRGNVEALLQAHANPQQLLDAPPAVPGVDLPEASERPGTVIGPYKLLEQIGEGGFGVVFMAEQTQPVRRKVAVKVLKPGMDTRQVIVRFEAERQALALMDHPHIAHILDGGETASGRPYFVMELVRGIPITDFCDRNQMPVRSRLELFLRICRAVQHAHQKGIIHRDLKPSNVLVTLHDGTPVPKVIDFGTAKALGQQLTDKTLFTNFTQMIGTPTYMSPEQAELSGLDIDTRSDVYSLGVLLYELLTGTTPCDKERLKTAAFDEIRRMIREEEPATPSRRITTLGAAATAVSARRSCDLRQLCQLVRGELDWIVMKALEKDRNRRYESAGAFSADVQHYLRDEPVQACPPSAWYRLQKTVRRHKGPVLAVALVVLALVGGIVGTTWGMLRATDAEAVAVNEARLKADALQEKEAALADAKGQLFLSRLSQARALRRSGEMGQRFQSLETLEGAVAIARSLGFLEEHRVALRTEVAACLALADLRVAEQWDYPARLEYPSWAPPVTFDARLERYAWADREGNLHVCAVSGRQEVVRLSGAGGQARDVTLRFSPEGRFLAAIFWFGGRPPQFLLWDLLGGRPTRRDIPGENVCSFTFGADGRLLALAQRDRSIALHDLVNGGRRNLAMGWVVGTVAFRPDGRQLAVTNDTRPAEVAILEPDTGKVLKEIHNPDDVKALAWSVDGRLLAAGCDDRNVHVWDTREWKLQAVLEGHQKFVTEVAFSPAGELLASTSADGTTRLWDPVSGRQLAGAPGMALGFSPDGQRLAFQRDSHLGTWEVADGRACQVLHHGRLGNRAPWPSYLGSERLDFSPDGRLLASVDGDGVRLWDVASRQEVAFLNSGHHEAALFHPDGARLWTFGRTGLRCWPLHGDDRGPNSLRLGPPELLGTPAVQGWFRGSLDRTGRLVAACDHLDDDRDRLLVFPADRPAERVALGDHSKVSSVALSPDGRWVAAGMIAPLGIKVWDARTGEQKWAWSGEHQFVTFSPDGRSLLGGGMADFRLWETESWEPGPVLPQDRREPWAGRAAFHPNGRLLALTRNHRQVQLLDLQTRREVATLIAPDQPFIEWLCFSPDGGLLAAATQSHTIQLWDLRAIGGRLWALGLGSDLLPDSSAAATPGSAGGAPPLRVRVFQDVYEAEHLPVVDSANAWPTVQDMKPWGREHWSNGKHLLCFTPKGGFVELLLEVPQTNRYALEVHLTQSPDFGTVEVALDGHKLGPTFDAYRETVGPSGPVPLGTVELQEGSHRLRFTAVDKNPKSIDYRMGIDCVKLTPQRRR